MKLVIIYKDSLNYCAIVLQHYTDCHGLGILLIQVTERVHKAIDIIIGIADHTLAQQAACMLYTLASA